MDIKKIFRKYILIYENDISFGNFSLPQDDLNEILKGYMEAALWTEEERLRDDYQETVGDSNDDFEDDDEDDEVEKLIKMRNKLAQTPFTSFMINDVENDSRIQAYLDVKNFIQLSGPDAIKEAILLNCFFKLGMDIWLTRNGHGAGFFDHNYEHEQQLMDAARKIKGVDLYLTDNMTLAFSNV